MKILKVKSSQGSLGRGDGSEEAPDKVLEALNQIFLNEDGKKVDLEVGEVKVVKNNLEETSNNISERSKDFDLILGGDHSITYSSFRSFSSGNCGLIMFDAHPDCEEGTNLATHEDFLRKLVDERIVKSENIILVGVRNFSENEINFLRDNKIKFFDMKKIFDLGVKEICDIIMENMSSLDRVYLSIDIDCVDPSMAPGVSYTEPGGLTSRELIYFVQRLKFMKNLKKVDLVDIIPKKDFNNLTVKLGAKIINELI